MPKRIDITGKKFGDLVAVKSTETFTERGELIWECKCVCGETTFVSGTALRAGKSKSCGCQKGKYVALGNPLKNGATLNGKVTSEFKTWRGIKRRCFDPTNRNYPNYGGRGITMCERWRNSFELFLKDMGRKPFPHYSIERDDVNGNYEPSNCRWIPLAEQQKNTTANAWIDYNGTRLIVTDWAYKLNISPALLRYHLQRRPFDEIYKRFITQQSPN